MLPQAVIICLAGLGEY